MRHTRRRFTAGGGGVRAVAQQQTTTNPDEPSTTISAYGTVRCTSWTGRPASRSRSTPPTPVMVPSSTCALGPSPTSWAFATPTTTNRPSAAASSTSTNSRNRWMKCAAPMPAKPASTACDQVPLVLQRGRADIEQNVAHQAAAEAHSDREHDPGEEVEFVAVVLGDGEARTQRGPDRDRVEIEPQRDVNGCVHSR